MGIYEVLVLWCQREEWRTSSGSWQSLACLFKVYYAGWTSLLFVSLKYSPS